MSDILILICGLLILLIAGDILVRGASGIAARLGIPPLIIGLTIVALGTSAPELMISVQAALQGSGGIAVGNVVGSNIANSLLVLAAPALFAAFRADEPGMRRNTSIMLAITIIFAILCIYTPITRLGGLFLFSMLILFLIYQFAQARAGRDGQNDEETEDAIASELHRPIAVLVIFLIVGFIGLPIGASFTVDGASALARQWHISEAAIAITVIALGTSLPELATGVMAALRNHGGVAIGNIIGSNIFNILAIMGISAMIVPINVPDDIIKLDLWVLIVTAVTLSLAIYLRLRIGRRIAALLIAAYCLFIISVFFQSAAA